jgi:hypothetical protein
MKVLSVSPLLRTASLLFQPHEGAWVQTVVAKATFELAPGKAVLASTQEDVHGQDVHFDDNSEASVYAPSDLAPLKPHADVVLVGSAFAPGGVSVRSLVVRLCAAGIDKSIEVFCKRIWTRDDRVREGGHWKQMPLRYERAAGGLDTWNPVGLSSEALPDKYGHRVAPNLQRPGLNIKHRSDLLPPIGFGPIASTWRLRREKLGARGATWSEKALGTEPLGDTFDAAYFQAAPADQQVDALRDDESILLEHLHPSHPRLETALPGVRPRAFQERPGSPAAELELRADTLWIDTERSLCTVTWRGQLPLQRPDEAGRVVVALEEPGERLSWNEVAARAGGALPSAQAPSGHMEFDASILDEPTHDARVSVVMSRSGQNELGSSGSGGDAPSVVPPGGAAPGESKVLVEERAPQGPAPPRDPVRRPTVTMVIPPELRTGLPDWIAPPGEKQPAPHGSEPPWQPPRVHPAMSTSDPAADNTLTPAATLNPSAGMPVWLAQRFGGAPPEPPPVPVPPPPVTAPPPPHAHAGVSTPDPATDSTLTPAAALNPSAGMPVWLAQKFGGAPPGPPPVPVVPVPPAPVTAAPLPFPAAPAPVPPAPAPVTAAPAPVTAAPLPFPAAPAPVTAAPLPFPAAPAPVPPAPAPFPPAPAPVTAAPGPVTAAPPPFPAAPLSVTAAPAPVPPAPAPVTASSVPADVPPGPPAERHMLFAAYAGMSALPPSSPPAPQAPAWNPPPRDTRVPEPPAEREPPWVDLIWFEPSYVPRIHKNPEWAKLMAKALPAQAPAKEAEAGGDSKPTIVRTALINVLSKSTPMGAKEIDEALALRFGGENAAPPPLVLLDGELELSFDELETLKILASAAAPLATGDKKLGKVLGLVDEMMKTPFQAAPEIVEGFIQQVRDAWMAANRSLPSTYLGTQTDRILLEQRHYRKRELLDDTWIRSQLAIEGFHGPVPAYLPATLAKKLPLFRRFAARVIVEVLPQQDQYEASPIALRVGALGRVLPSPSRTAKR